MAYTPDEAETLHEIVSDLKRVRKYFVSAEIRRAFWSGAYAIGIDAVILMLRDRGVESLADLSPASQYTFIDDLTKRMAATNGDL